MCPLCRDGRSTLFDQREFRGHQVVNRLCRKCGLVYQSPRMTSAELNLFYQDEYRRLYQGNEEPSDRDLAVQKARAVNLVDFLRDNGVNEVERYLDIGCSSGLLLKEIREAYQCQVLGVEPGAAYRNYAQDRGLEVYESLEALKTAGYQDFDLISMIHVLEHLPDPVRYLNELREDLLSPGGRILVEVPNLYAHDCFEVAHLVSFSPHSLSQVLRQAGFKTITWLAHGTPRSMIIPLYISLLAKPGISIPSEDSVAGEKWIRLKRRTGMAQRKVMGKLFPRQAWLPEYRSKA